MSELITIPVPGELSLSQYGVEIGDTTAFVDKINGMQVSLDAWSQELTVCVQGIQQAADQIGVHHSDVQQKAQQVTMDRTAAQQAAVTTGQHLALTTQNKEEAQQAAVTTGEHLALSLQNKEASEQAAVTTGEHLALSIQNKEDSEQAVALAQGFAAQATVSADAAQSVSDISELHLCLATISAPVQVAAYAEWIINLSGQALLVGLDVDHFAVSWGDGTASIVPAVSGSAEAVFLAPAYPAADVSVSVVAVDTQGHRSPAVIASASVTENLPPAGSVIINHQTSVVQGESFQVALSGVTDSDGDNADIRYEIVDDGGLGFAKTADIAAGELVSVTAPAVSSETVAVFSVRAVDSVGAPTAVYDSAVTVQEAWIAGVRLAATGGNGGTWAHIDLHGNDIAVPAPGWFNAHPVYSGIVDQIIDGQYMVRIPKFYYKRGLASDGSMAWWISDRQIDGFTVFPAFVLNGSEVDQFWYGKYQASSASGGGILRSVPGVNPIVNITLSAARTRSGDRNIVNNVSGFRLLHIDMLLAVQWLYLIEHATMDSQSHTGTGRVTGVGSVAAVDATDVAQATYRGIVGLWGNVDQWLDGIRTYQYTIERRSYDGDWQSTGESTVVLSSYHYPVTFRASSKHLFVADTHQSGISNATMTDPNMMYNGAGSSAGSTPFYFSAGGSYSGSSYAGLYYLVGSRQDSSAASYLGARIARVV